MTQVACDAKADGQGCLLGVLYDEIVRKKWEDLSSKRHSFKPGRNVGAVHEESKRRAIALYQNFYKKYNADGEAPVVKADRKRAKDEQVGALAVVRLCLCVGVLVSSGERSQEVVGPAYDSAR